MSEFSKLVKRLYNEPKKEVRIKLVEDLKIIGAFEDKIKASKEVLANDKESVEARVAAATLLGVFARDADNGVKRSVTELLIEVTCKEGEDPKVKEAVANAYKKITDREEGLVPATPAAQAVPEQTAAASETAAPAAPVEAVESPVEITLSPATTAVPVAKPVPPGMEKVHKKLGEADALLTSMESKPTEDKVEEQTESLIEKGVSKLASMARTILTLEIPNPFSAKSMVSMRESISSFVVGTAKQMKKAVKNPVKFVRENPTAAKYATIIAIGATLVVFVPLSQLNQAKSKEVHKAHVSVMTKVSNSIGRISRKAKNAVLGRIRSREKVLSSVVGNFSENVSDASKHVVNKTVGVLSADQTSKPVPKKQAQMNAEEKAWLKKCKESYEGSITKRFGPVVAKIKQNGYKLAMYYISIGQLEQGKAEYRKTSAVKLFDYALKHLESDDASDYSRAMADLMRAVDKGKAPNAKKYHVIKKDDDKFYLGLPSRQNSKYVLNVVRESFWKPKSNGLTFNVPDSKLQLHRNLLIHSGRIYCSSRKKA